MASPLYPQNGISSDAVLDTANTNTDGTTGTNVTIATGTSGGNDEIECVIWQAAGTTTAGMLRFFVHDGTSAVMVAQVPIPPHTPVNTYPQIPALSGVVDFVQIYGRPIRLPSTSHTLKGNTHVSETFRVLAQGRKYI